MLKHTTSYSMKTKPRPRSRRATTGYQLPRGRARATRRKGATYLNRSHGFGRRGGYRASGRNTRKPYAFIAVGCAFLFFVASIIWYANRSVEITYNGEAASVRINATIEQYITDNGLDAEYDAGDLLAVNDTVLERGGGDRYTVTLNGEPVAADAYATTHLAGGEELTIADGADVYEDHDVQATDIEPTLTIKGTGAIAYVSTWGIPGRTEVWTGKQSGITQDRGVVKEVQNCEVTQTSVHPDDDQKLIALTFDEGPSSYTEQILGVLSEHGVKATFFLSGDATEVDPAAAKAIVDAGCEVGSNSYQDTDLTKLSGDDLRTQLTQGFDAIENATGKQVSLLRAPYAAFSGENWCDAMDLVSAVVSWNLDSGDWLLPGADDVVSTVVGSARTGNIVLLTDSDATGAQAVEALPQIIEQLSAEGFSFVTLSDLVASDADLAEQLDLTKVSMPDDATLPAIATDETEGSEA